MTHEHNSNCSHEQHHIRQLHIEQAGRLCCMGVCAHAEHQASNMQVQILLRQQLEGHIHDKHKAATISNKKKLKRRPNPHFSLGTIANIFMQPKVKESNI